MGGRGGGIVNIRQSLPLAGGGKHISALLSEGIHSLVTFRLTCRAA